MILCVSTTIWTYKELVLDDKTAPAPEQPEIIIIKYEEQKEKQQKVKEVWNFFFKLKI